MPCSDMRLSIPYLPLNQSPNIVLFPLIDYVVENTHFRSRTMLSTYHVSFVKNTSTTLFLGSSFQKLHRIEALQIDVDVGEISSSGEVGQSKTNIHSPEEACGDVSSDYPEDLDFTEMEKRREIEPAKKKRIPWNKGISPDAETRKRISERTKEAMRDPKVRKKMAEVAERPDWQRNLIKAKISATNTKHWSRRLKVRRQKQKFFCSWAISIAETAKVGGIGENELGWDSYDELLEKTVLQKIQQAEEMAETRKEWEEKARRDQEEKARREQEEKARREIEKARILAEKKREREEKVRREREEKMRIRAEKRREREEKARREHEEKARIRAEKRREREEKARILAEKRRKREEKARILAEKKREREEKARILAEKRRKREEKARILAEKRREMEEKARTRKKGTKKSKEEELAAAQEMKLKQKLKQIRIRKRPNQLAHDQVKAVVTLVPHLEKLDLELVKKVKMRTKVSLADQLEAAKSKRAEYVASGTGASEPTSHIDPSSQRSTNSS